MRKGFTLPELLIALGIITVLFAITTITLLRTSGTATKSAQVDTFLADLRDQQNQAMAQNTAGEATNSDYGIYLSSNSYTLFRGSVYDANNSSNFVIELEPTVTLTNITFPSSTIIFKSGTGEVDAFVDGSNAVSIEDSRTDDVDSITLNKYGVPLE